MRNITNNLDLFQDDNNPPELQEELSASKKSKRNSLSRQVSKNDLTSSLSSISALMSSSHGKLTHTPLQIKVASDQPNKLIGNMKHQENSYHADSAHSHIQNIWSTYGSMTDSQRNQLLKGLIARSGKKQMELVCTSLNLKMSEIAQTHVSTLTLLTQGNFELFFVTDTTLFCISLAAEFYIH